MLSTDPRVRVFSNEKSKEGMSSNAGDDADNVKDDGSYDNGDVEYNHIDQVEKAIMILERGRGKMRNTK